MDEELRTFLEDAASRAPETPISLSIRELLTRWGHKRRGYWVVERIQRDLERNGLTTEPPFTRGWIDSRIRLVPKAPRMSPEDAALAEEPQVSEEPAEEVSPEVALQIGTLRSSSAGVTLVSPQQDLLFAQSLMMRHDYSQLAVISGTRTLEGAITWESIAQARMKHETIQLKDCVIPADPVRLEQDLLPLIPRINDAGFVFVRAPDNAICGIVTASDIADEFARLARPFFLIGEIERRLRISIVNVFSLEEIQALGDPSDSHRPVESSDDLTLGEHARLLENPDNWKRMHWEADRKLFVEALHKVRELRNDIMHFSPDPLEDDQVEELRLFIRWLKFLQE